MNSKIAKFVFIKTGWFEKKLYPAVTFHNNDYLLYVYSKNIISVNGLKVFSK